MLLLCCSLCQLQCGQMMCSSILPPPDQEKPIPPKTCIFSWKIFSFLNILASNLSSKIKSCGLSIGKLRVSVIILEFISNDSVTLGTEYAFFYNGIPEGQGLRGILVGSECLCSRGSWWGLIWPQPPGDHHPNAQASASSSDVMRTKC